MAFRTKIYVSLNTQDLPKIYFYKTNSYTVTEIKQRASYGCCVFRFRNCYVFIFISWFQIISKGINFYILGTVIFSILKFSFLWLYGWIKNFYLFSKSFILEKARLLSELNCKSVIVCFWSSPFHRNEILKQCYRKKYPIVGYIFRD